MNPPAAPPSAFPRVLVMMSTSPRTPKCSAVPRPVAPSTPEAWESSITTTAPSSRAICRMSGSFAMDPSMEKTPSVQMSLRGAARCARSCARRWSMSACRYTAVVHFVAALASRMESMMEAWLRASEMTKSPSRAREGVSASLAFQAET